MKRPAGLGWVIGQPPVAVLIFGAGLFGIYLWLMDRSAWPVGLGGLVLLAWAAKSAEQVAKYRAWKRAWRAMEGAGPTAPLSPATKRGLLLASGGATALFLYANRANPDAAALLLLLLGVGAVAGLVMLIRRAAQATRGGTRSTAPPTAPVAICVRKPFLPVPDLQRAYEALPAHCWKALNAGRE